MIAPRFEGGMMISTFGASSREVDLDITIIPKRRDLSTAKGGLL
jgi:hypothetical protein